MPWNIPASNLPTTIPVTDPPQSIVAPFPELWLPLSGPWVITVPLSTDFTGCPVTGLIELIQQQDAKVAVIAATNVTLTTTPTNYVLNVSDFSGVNFGECSVTQLALRVTAIRNCACCTISASSVTVTFTSSCSILNGLTMTLRKSGTSFVGGVFVSGYTFQFGLSCNAGFWQLTGSSTGACGFGATTTDFTCTPTVSGHFSNGTVVNCSGGAPCVIGDTFSATVSP
eukprot:TRINITY_DN31_c3_g1_i3.p1 TRINITY_DN31_c3_g1~~TRINITY_DN31_c3_g1_i3.p1  ORF type:complete len:227 (+),score=27.34 TRINITY_DN31_c3_g1_i3:700-1380(+)